jgi:quinol monooxygenase YgiN
MKIYLTAVIHSKPEFREAIGQVLRNMVVQTRKEKACLQYDLHQGSEDENLFVFYEIWENQAGLDAHNNQPYIRDFVTFTLGKLSQEAQIYLTQKL